MPMSRLTLAASSALLAGSLAVGASASIGALQADRSAATGDTAAAPVTPLTPATPMDLFADRLELADEQASMLAFEQFADVPVGGFVEVVGLPIGGGETLDLEMERITVLAPGAQVIEVGADGVERDAGPQQLVLLRGSVRGDDESMVVLGISPEITNGHIEAF